MQNNQFGFVNPFGQQQQQTAPRGNPRYNRQAPQQQQGEFYDEEDPKYATQAYLKISFKTNKGVKKLNTGKTDIKLREASPLETMILNYWKSGRDVNELLAIMQLEVVDANPDNSDLEFDFSNVNFIVEEEEEEEFEEAPKPKPRSRKPAAAAE